MFMTRFLLMPGAAYLPQVFVTSEYKNSRRCITQDFSNVKCEFVGCEDTSQWRCYFRHVSFSKNSQHTQQRLHDKQCKLQFHNLTEHKISPWHHLPLYCCSGNEEASTIAQTNKNIAKRPQEEEQLSQQKFQSHQVSHITYTDTITHLGSLLNATANVFNNNLGQYVDRFVYVNEIPLNSCAKLQMMKHEAYNPIAQDDYKKLPGKPLRYFRYGKAPFNYGFMPQTWQDPQNAQCFQSHSTPLKGDGDPLDVVLLGPVTPIGCIHAIKILGVLGLVDEGQLDWKIIAQSVPYIRKQKYISAVERTAANFHKISNVASHDSNNTSSYSVKQNTHVNIKAEDDEAHISQQMKHIIIDWFQNYKTVDGKPQNEFLYNARIRGVEAAIEVIACASKQYNELITRKINKYNYWYEE